MRSSTTRNIRYVQKPVDGKDAVLYRLIPSYSAVTISNQNGVMVPTGNTLTMRVTRQSGEDSPVTVKPTDWMSEYLLIEYQFLYANGDVGLWQEYDSTNGISVSPLACGVRAKLYKDSVELDSVTVPFIADGKDGQNGSRGDRGPALRGPQSWSDLPVGYQFRSGAEGEEFKDVVLYGSNYYSCQKSHVKTADNFPGSRLDNTNGYWSAAEQFEIIATRILLAQYALVKNLGVESLEMKDEAGNILCRIKNGEITVKTGTFQNVKLIGSLRNPFTFVSDSFNSDYNDNVAMLSSGNSFTKNYALPWDVSQSGRRITIANFKWDGTLALGFPQITAPTGKYFYEDGVAKSQLRFSREMVELVGYGTPTEFYGWIVVNRVDMMTSGNYGRKLKALAYGTVAENGTLVTYKTFDDTTLSVSKHATIKGRYTVSIIGKTWFKDPLDCMVLLTGVGFIEGSTTSPIKASLVSRSATGFVVATSDDDSPNDGAFDFLIINRGDWLTNQDIT